MFVVRCVNKHFFDFDSQQFCPECARLGMVYDIERLPECPACRKPILFYDSKHRVVCENCGESALTHCICGNRVVNYCSECGAILPGAEIGLGYQINRNSAPPPFPGPIPTNDGPQGGNDSGTVSEYDDPSPIPVNPPVFEEPVGYGFGDDSKTESGYPGSSEISKDDTPVKNGGDIDFREDIPKAAPSYYGTPTGDSYGEITKTESEYYQPTQEDKETPEVDVPKGELEAEVQKVVEDNSDRTQGFYESLKAKKSNSDENEYLNPVVGWLVCVAGKHLGESFNVYSGHNSIGRNSTNKIVLNRDRTVSGECHAYIVFEPEKKETYIKPGTGTGFVHINDNAVLEVKKIKGYEKIKLGSAELMYIPLCGNKFDWAEYISKE